VAVVTVLAAAVAVVAAMEQQTIVQK